MLNVERTLTASRSSAVTRIGREACDQRGWAASTRQPGAHHLGCKVRMLTPTASLTTSTPSSRQVPKWQPNLCLRSRRETCRAGRCRRDARWRVTHAGYRAGPQAGVPRTGRRGRQRPDADLGSRCRRGMDQGEPTPPTRRRVGPQPAARARTGSKIALDQGLSGVPRARRALRPGLSTTLGRSLAGCGAVASACRVPEPATFPGASHRSWSQPPFPAWSLESASMGERGGTGGAGERRRPP